MDKKNGFKECPRCGLRNKPMAKQCDFCGQRFEVADDWEEQIEALEKLTKPSKKSEPTDELSRRIESTRVTKGMAENREKRPAEPIVPVQERESDVPPIVLASVPKPPVATATATEEKPLPLAEKMEYAGTEQVEKRPEPEIQPVVLMPLMEQNSERKEEEVGRPAPDEKVSHFSDKEQTDLEAAKTVPKGAAMASVSVEVPNIAPLAFEEPMPQAVIVSEPSEIEQSEKVHRKMWGSEGKIRPALKANIFQRKFNLNDRRTLTFSMILVIGIGFYAATLVMLGGSDLLVKWGMVGASGLLMVIGFARVGMNWDVSEEPVRVDIPGTGEDEVVEICPSCHERLNPDMQNCPACGLELEPSENR